MAEVHATDRREPVEFLPPQKADVLWIDLPWHWKARSKKGEESRGAHKHYDVCSDAFMAGFPFKSLCHDHTAIFYWVTDPCLMKAAALFPQHGFRYSSVAFYWFKQNKGSDQPFVGQGYCTRANPEQCWLLRPKTSKMFLKRADLGVQRAFYAPASVTPSDEWTWMDAYDEKEIVTHLGDHSAKPLEAQRRIEQLFGDTFTDPKSGEERPLVRIELFARNRRAGWVGMGLELDGMCHTESIPMYLRGEYPVDTTALRAAKIAERERLALGVG